MENFIKYTWMFLVASGFLCLVVNLPYSAWQNAYIDELNRIQTAPQVKIDATYRYLEAIESGKEDISNGILQTPPKKYYRKIPREQIRRVSRAYASLDYDMELPRRKPQTKVQKKYQKPLYRRDPKNPKILHPVR